MQEIYISSTERKKKTKIRSSYFSGFEVFLSYKKLQKGNRKRTKENRQSKRKNTQRERERERESERTILKNDDN